MRFIYLLFILITISSSFASLFKRSEKINAPSESTNSESDVSTISTHTPDTSDLTDDSESKVHSTPISVNPTNTDNTKKTDTSDLKNDPSTDNTNDVINLNDNLSTSTDNTEKDDINNLNNDSSLNNDSTSTVNNSVIKTEESTSECQKFMVDFIKCFPNNLVINEESCNKFYTNECQALLNGDKNICGSEKSIVLFEYQTLPLKFGCAKNEKGDYCPQFKLFNKDQTKSVEDLDVTEIQEICQSKCSENALENYNQRKQLLMKLIELDPTNNYNDFINKVNKSIDALNNGNCITNTSNSFLKVGGIILGSVVLILICILVAFMFIKKSKKDINNDINNEIESDTSSGRIIFLNKPQLTDINVINNQNNIDNIDILSPPPAYDDGNTVRVNNDNKHEQNLYSTPVNEEMEQPPEYTEINE